MKTLTLALFTSVLCWAQNPLSSQDRAENPPQSYPLREQWRASACKAKPIGTEQSLGAFHTGGISSEQECFFKARLSMILLDQDPELSVEFHELNRREQIVIYEDGLGYKKICHLVPLKNPYSIHKEELDEYFTQPHDADLADSGDLRRRMEQNIRLDCPEM